MYVQFYNICLYNISAFYCFGNWETCWLVYMTGFKKERWLIGQRLKMIDRSKVNLLYGFQLKALYPMWAILLFMVNRGSNNIQCEISMADRLDRALPREILNPIEHRTFNLQHKESKCNSHHVDSISESHSCVKMKIAWSISLLSCSMMSTNGKGVPQFV